MAIEGPLRELGIHDVFQLLDLSRKTGTLRVASELRDNEGRVLFDRGKIVGAEIRSNPHPLGQLLLRTGKLTEADLSRARALQAERGDRRRLGEILVDIGAISPRELERQVRAQIEAVVFELMSWREGFFSFVDGHVGDVAIDAAVTISTESLLMEGARRIDEWSRIADKVPNLQVVPALSETTDDQAGVLDLLPNEWEVLASIDGTRDIRAIATDLARSEFDVAKIVYGLLTTGVIELRRPGRTTGVTAAATRDASGFVQEARRAITEKRLDAALDFARQAVAMDPQHGGALLAVSEVLLHMGRARDAAESLHAASEADPLNEEVQRLRGIAAAARGDFDDAVNAWGKFLQLAPTHADAERIRTALEAAARLRNVVEDATHG